ncbi:MAG: Maf family nucleotide pyrophosphatase [Verrucomicrobiota bacterium]|nr:Maf family nucleotide pyrophosphatase [Verrucomicrobiota bacterium]
MNTRLILGSASQRRRNILADLGVEFDIVIPQIEEVSCADDPRRAAAENALRKNLWCRREHPGRFIVTADTTISFDGRCVEKPRSMDEALDFLRGFSGKLHTVVTAVGLGAPALPTEMRLVESVVTFLTLTDCVIQDYFSKVNPLDKAGAYDIDQHGELLIRSFSGSRTNIMGLPAELVGQWLWEQGLL